MIFADKVIRLRKKNGWSQEELAEKMETSRQAVSKWEGAQSVPDISKILQLSRLFGVTTDYLLRDDIEDEEYTDSDGDGDRAVKHVSLADAGDYLESRRAAARRIAIAAFLCIISPITLILLGAASEHPEYGISESIAAAVGMTVLFLLATVAVALFVYTGFRNTRYEFLDKEPFINEYGVSGMVRERQNAYRERYALANIIGTCLCVISPVPLIVVGVLSGSDMLCVIMLAVTMLVAGSGVVLFILAGVHMAAMQRLLREGEFSSADKKASKITEAISTVYWLIAVAVYLGASFITNDWNGTWIVWPVAGVLYAAVSVMCKLLVKVKNGDD